MSATAASASETRPRRSRNRRSAKPGAIAARRNSAITRPCARHATPDRRRGDLRTLSASATALAASRRLIGSQGRSQSRHDIGVGDLRVLRRADDEHHLAFQRHLRRSRRRAGRAARGAPPRAAWSARARAPPARSPSTAARSASVSATRDGASKNTSVAGTLRELGERVRRAALLGGRKPANRNVSVGSPATRARSAPPKRPGSASTRWPASIASRTSL